MKGKLSITIGRQFGSGGHEIGELLAKRLGIDFIDREIIAEAAKSGDIARSVIESLDEKPTTSFLYSLVMGLRPGKPASGEYEIPLPQQVFLAEYNAIRRIASEKPAVFVGRCADYALQDASDCIRVFIYAPVEARISRIEKRNHIDRGQAASLIQKTDKNRASYYNYYSGKKWGHPESYDICVSSQLCGMEKTVDFLEGLVKAYQEGRA